MKAALYTRYGSPDVLRIKEVDQPQPKANEVLVKIRATAVNDYDWSMVRGKPYAYRLLFGLFKPKHPILGMEMTGTVAALGSEVANFKVGDSVYGDTSDFGFGCFAEYVCINEKAVVHKPEAMTFEEAAAVSHASMLALQGLIDIGQLQQGQHILINGAGGGVGTFGVQLAKLYAANTTGVDTGKKLSKMKSMGFDQVLDYQQEDFTKNGERYNLILDAKTNRSPFAYLRSLKPNGTYATVGGTLPRLIQLLLFKGIIALFFKRRFHIVALKPNKDLEYINQLFEEGKIKPVLDGQHSLEDAPKVLHYFGAGLHTGKVVMSV